jgi:hypothetical protein
MDDMPDFEMPAADAPAPKKQRRKPMKRVVKRAALKPPKQVPVKRRKRRKARKIPTGRRVLAEAGKLSHVEFAAAFTLVTSLSKFENDAKKRILAKAAEAWT